MSSPDRDLHERASALFLRLRDLSPEERTRELEAEAPTGTDLHREVASLLDHDTKEGTAADCRAGGVPASLPAVPNRIGPYTIIRRIGHGGSGYVLLAEQLEPVRRHVAIKIVPHAAVDPEFAARFEFERRALERTEHPNIARILDAGRTPDGLPYLVMDYVQGTPLAGYCNEHRLTLRDRITLILDVADAVQHAHQRGVIHRDLKPANVLVSELNGRPTPRILDFGIAKPIADAFGADSPRTSGMAIGTPAYMAPEQTGGRAVDTRADVYAIGAVLYELVCGRPPIEVKGDAVEVLRRIRDHIPPPASRIRAADSILSEDSVTGSILSDVDCILAKALEKDPDRRYQTVAALADDLRRLLRFEPIHAHPPTIRYRTVRFAQRNRVLVATIAIGGLAVAVGIAGLTTGLIEANRQKREAAYEFEAQRDINSFLTDDLLAGTSPDQAGQAVSALDLLRHAGLKVDERFANRPLIAASIHHTLGVAYTELGAYDDAKQHLDRAVALRRESAGPDNPETVHSEIAAASLLARRQQLPDAEAALRKAIDRARLILGADDRELYSALNDLGVTYETMDRGKEAVALLQEALAGRIRLLGPHDPRVLMTTSNLADAYDRVGQTDRALQMNLDALKVADALPDPPRFALIGLNNNIGATLQDLNRDQEAIPYLRRAAELADKWLGPDNPDTLSLRGNLAGIECKLGDAMKGAALYDSVVKARTRLMGPDAYDTLVARYGYWDSYWHAKKYDEATEGLTILLADMERALKNENHWLAIQTRALLAHVLSDGGHPDRAFPYAKQATEEFTALYGPDHARTRNIAALLKTLQNGGTGSAAK
jgi:serine/threonine protein kinase